jgi:putative sigma-54 modulation protein
VKLQVKTGKEGGIGTSVCSFPWLRYISLAVAKRLSYNLIEEGKTMELEIRGQNFRVGEPLQEHIKRQMNFALDPFESWLAGAAVHLEDVNGPKGGIDKQCRILVNLKGGKTLKIEDVDTDFTLAVNRAADRLGQAVSREIDKRREKKGLPPALPKGGE